MEIKEEIELKIQEIESLKKSREQLYIQNSQFRRLKDRDNDRKTWKQIKEIDNKIDENNVEIGKAYEKKALSLNSEEKLPLLIRALEYYKLSSYTESIRILTEAKQIFEKNNDMTLVNMCKAQILKLECKELDNKAEELWNNIRHSDITEHDDICIQLSIYRDSIVKKLKDGLKYAEESNSQEIVVDFYRTLTWNLYRRCDRGKFLNEIKMYHKKAAVILECLSWKNYPTNKEVSRKYLDQASFLYYQASSNDDVIRINEILLNAFNLSDYDHFYLVAKRMKTVEDVENLEKLINKSEFDGRDKLISRLKLMKAAIYSGFAIENIDDNTSFFIAAQYFEEYHKDSYADSEMGPEMGDSFLRKSQGNLRLAINNGILTRNGEKHLNMAIEQIKKAIAVSDWAFVEPTYLRIYETINLLIHQPINELNHKRIGEILNNSKFMIGQENTQKERKILIYMKQFLESLLINDDRISALNCIKNIDNTIVSKEEVDFERFSKMQLNKEPLIEMWDKCKTESNNQKKGKLLEQFTISLFSTIKNFILVDSNVHTVNEEFDAIFRNDIEKPFLQSLSSPLIIFECKNWSKKVDVTQVEAFETKLINHYNLARVGIFISINGFEAGCEVQQIRLSRSHKIIILLTGEEIEKFLISTRDTLEWLEELICSGFK